MTEAIYFYLLRVDFIVEFMVAGMLFSMELPRRKLFALKVVLCCLVTVGAFVLWDPVKLSDWYFDVLRFFLSFCLVTAGIFVCYKVSLQSALFCSINAYTLQFISYKIYETVIHFTGYGIGWPLLSVLYFGIHGVVFSTVWFFYIRKIRLHGNIERSRNVIVGIAGGFVLYEIVYNLIFLEFAKGLTDTQYVVFQSASVLFGIFCYLILYFIFKDDRDYAEREVLRHMMYAQKQQYGLAKDAVDIINIKCHDIRHRLDDDLSSFGSDIEELKKSIDIYDATTDTSNEALNIVFSEKRLICNHKDIRFTYVADGEAVSFMSPSEIYSLFGNMIDNAVRAVVKLDAEDRVVSLTVKKKAGFCVIHCENPYRGELKLDDGIPVTTQEDKNYHGFGIKSMRMTVKKYGGEIVIGVGDRSRRVFSVDIAVPYPKKEDLSRR